MRQCLKIVCLFLLLHRTPVVHLRGKRGLVFIFYIIKYLLQVTSNSNYKKGTLSSAFSFLSYFCPLTFYFFAGNAHSQGQHDDIFFTRKRLSASAIKANEALGVPNVSPVDRKCAMYTPTSETSVAMTAMTPRRILVVIHMLHMPVDFFLEDLVNMKKGEEKTKLYARLLQRQKMRDGQENPSW